jgi:hypothetical protein
VKRIEHLYKWYKKWNETDTDQVAADDDDDDDDNNTQDTDVFVCLVLHAGK